MDETPRVFGGTLSSPHPPSVETAPVLPRNRKVVRRKISTFNLILVLLTSAVAIVLYIGNVIRVGELAGEIGKLQEAHQRNLNDQEILRAHINHLSSLDRIQSMAEKTLGLVNPKQPTVWMDIDREKVQEVASDIAEARERRLKKK
ncbi:MAG: hypothetical protein HY966_07405 [Ignavibacteriales bacterium]|nr:hypothetical protein [Ignavibacteriales bacterium]